jgi:hypothetical protein
VSEYLEMAKEGRKGKRLACVVDTFRFVVDSFNVLLGKALLYKKEKAQVHG